MRFFPDIDESTVIEVLPLFQEMFEERDNENVDLEYNLEIIQNAIKGKIDITQTGFNVYGYNVRCAENKEKSLKSNKRKESFLFNSGTDIETSREQLKAGGISEEVISFNKYSVEKRDDFDGGEYEKLLTIESLLRKQKSFLSTGILLGRVIKEVAKGNKRTTKLLSDLVKKDSELKEVLMDALEVWELEELSDQMEKMYFESK